ncbi:MAG: hypothetical protein ACLTT4_00810 [Coprobacillus cateniformis]|jgi:small nuclear ribonucleoprotein (snRNP)-like protein|nr:hypothetical protein [Coprobacillus cateniformis]
MKKLLILLKNTKNLLEYGDYGISGNTTFLGIYTSYDKLHERVLRDVKSINIREEEDESKDIFNRNIYRSIITDDEIREYVVIEANEDEDYEKLVESYCYLE